MTTHTHPKRKRGIVRPHLRLGLSSLALLLLATASIRGQEVAVKTEGFWDDDQRRQSAVAVQMIAQADPYVAALLRIEGRGRGIWHEPVYTDREIARGAPELDAGWLRQIKDRSKFPDFRGVPPDERDRSNLVAYGLFCQALHFARIVPLEAFQKSAENNDQVTFADFLRSKDQWSRYRGKVIPIEGRLRRLRRTESPRRFIEQDGVHHVYEGWIEGPTKNAPLYWVIVPWAPEDKDDPAGLLKPAEEMDRPVKFYGYFIKLIAYPRQELDSKGTFRTVYPAAPVLIGPTLIVTGKDNASPPPTVEPEVAPFSSVVLAILATCGGVALAIMVGLTWWFYRGDQAFRNRLHRFHADQALHGLDNPTDATPPFADHQPPPPEPPTENDAPKQPG